MRSIYVSIVHVSDHNRSDCARKCSDEDQTQEAISSRDMIDRSKQHTAQA
jgi:hypothetical protein